MQISFFSTAQPKSADHLTVHVVPQGKMPELGNVVAAGAAASRFTGKSGQFYQTFVDGGAGVERVGLLGLGDAAGAGADAAGAALVGKVLTSGVNAITLDFSQSGLDAEGIAQLLLGATLRAFRHDVYRTKLRDDQKPTLNSIAVLGAPAGTDAAWERESAVAKGVALTRELVTEPANIIYPESFVARCQERMAGTGIEFVVLDKAEITRLGMGALLGASQGSPRDPRVLAMRWKGAEAAKPTVFIGKGVTFDTGGISIKPAAGMEDMKWDMGGAAAVAGAMLALAGRKAKADVVGICGLVENMPDGAAQRPGDVVTTMSGQTVEVINTDAEGRLVLCDVLTWAQQTFSPTTVVDLATLTGAMIISLGHEHGGLFSNDDTLAENLLAAGRASGDKLWRFPLGSAYDKLIDSPIADMKNVGPRYGGSITAAQFIQRYVDKGVAWAHLDIAGMVWAEKAGGTWDKGATGFGVRLIDRFVRDTLER